MIVVYTVIFSQVMRAPAGVDDGLAYSVYLCAGLLTWGPVRGNHLAQPEHVHRERQPAEEDQLRASASPVIVLLNAGVNFAIILALFLGFRPQRAPAGRGIARAGAAAGDPGAVRGGTGDDPRGALNVFFRDVGQLFGICLQFWFWLTPIVIRSASCPRVSAR